MPTTLFRSPLALALSIALYGGQLYAETRALEEVIVTAQKREQNLQDTPIAISAFNVSAIEEQGIEDISDISQYLPNVEIAPSPGGNTGATISIRGLVTGNPAVTWEPSVGIYVDGVFVAKNVGGLFDVAELERVEILRGPQGTLYGKNTLGGAINLITRKPSEEFGGTLKLSSGNYDYKEGFFSLDTGRLAERAAFNIALSVRQRDGFYDNTSRASEAADEFKKLDTTAVRLTGSFDITDQLEAFYIFDQSKKDNTPSFAQLDLPGSRVERRREGANDGGIEDTSDTFGHALHLTYQLSDIITLKSISAYRSTKFKDAGDYDGTDVIGFHTVRDVESDQISQEFQWLGKSDRFDYVLGAFYFKEDSDALNPFHLFGNNNVVRNGYGVKSESHALFGQLDYYLTDQWTLTGGIRWTREEKEAFLQRQDNTPGSNFGGNISRLQARDDWSNISPTVALTYAFSDDTSVYFKVSEGWKAGGFNGEAPSVEAFKQSYDEEKITAFEAGLKSRWFNDRLQLNTALFQNNVKDLQISNFQGAYSLVDNAGRATMRGIELEAMAVLTNQLTFNLNYGYLDSKYDSYKDLNGNELKDTNRFTYAPENKISAGLTYHQDLGFANLTGRLDYSWVDTIYLSPNPVAAELTKTGDYRLWNARIALEEIKIGPEQTLEIAVWGKNLGDEEYRINGITVGGNNNGTGAVNYYGDPRTYGIEAVYRF
ncbi:TonB-dependent receptor [Endozoicomonas arenosclerae]|uniref:TonB-dependent receptor n=1 Tax=Endozoicomonas arenosclerae TaxID=1633495 RepID=UPI00078440FD|nr:TonB-dependent receptor [Endozoicomonas arenosclerae]